MGSFPVAIPDIASRAEYVRSQLETLRVSRPFRTKILWKIFAKRDSFGEINFEIYVRSIENDNSRELLLLLFSFFPFASRVLLRSLKYVRIDKINRKIV